MKYLHHHRQVIDEMVVLQHKSSHSIILFINRTQYEQIYAGPKYKISYKNKIFPYQELVAEL